MNKLLALVVSLVLVGCATTSGREVHECEKWANYKPDYCDEYFAQQERMRQLAELDAIALASLKTRNPRAACLVESERTYNRCKTFGPIIGKRADYAVCKGDFEVASKLCDTMEWERGTLVPAGL